MKKSLQYSAPGKRPAENGKRAEEEAKDSCRCEEVSKKKPVELLKLMFDDLAFWKKKKTG
jgi:hypothetical protein